MDEYAVVIYWSNEDEAFIAEVPELPGCLTHGDTRRAAVENAEEAIQLWLDTAKEFNRPAPKPKGGRMVLSCAEPEHIRLRKQQPTMASSSVKWKNKASLYPRIHNPRTR